MKINHIELAVSDLVKIFDYIARDNKKIALGYITKPKNKIELLSDFPEMGVTCRSKNIDSDCRILIYEDYLVFYELKSSFIRILRVLYSSIDYQKLLSAKT